MPKKGRKAWNSTMVDGGHAPLKKSAKRASGRISVVSKSMKVVDAETRSAVKDARLDKLEADNYTEEQDAKGDDEFIMGDEPDALKPKVKRAKGGRKNNKSRIKVFRNLHQVLYELVGQVSMAEPDTDDSGEESAKPSSRQAAAAAADRPGTSMTYEKAAAPPSAKPARHFCSVCGYFGYYTCTRCGMRFCSINCNTQHKETRCLKFAA
ncbi:unnamed protein product [Chrysoparadoxa australica]